MVIPGGDRRHRNRQLIAERAGWPDDALPGCLELEAEFPGWVVYWSRGGLPHAPEPGFRAFTTVGWRKFDAYGETAQALRERLAAAVKDLPRSPR
ncbi:hypothetical protein [Actinoplanes sp. NPDC049316]|uniref:hypothetical protein n=1 Tax=Actinoplanes sp. NPDC049316 TaxID=3154727 RepID=UPI003423D064